LPLLPDHRIMRINLLVLFLNPLADDPRQLRMLMHDKPFDVPVKIPIKVIPILQVLVSVLLLNRLLLLFRQLLCAHLLLDPLEQLFLNYVNKYLVSKRLKEFADLALVVVVTQDEQALLLRALLNSFLAVVLVRP
jgi:hypothetical protein